MYSQALQERVALGREFCDLRRELLNHLSPELYGLKDFILWWTSEIFSILYAQWESE